MTEPVEQWTTLVTRVRASNPGPMTLDGTNSLVIRAPGHDGVVVVDPGPEEPEHLERLAGYAPVELILVTHHHRDHTEGIGTLVAMTGAPVRAWDPAFSRDAAPLGDGERLDVAGTRIRVVATPGHTRDSISLHLPDDAALGRSPLDSPRAGGTMVTGDTILGRGTTVIVHPDGAVGPYLDSLDTLEGFGAIPALPAHGPMLPDLAAICRHYRGHRQLRLDQMRDVLRSLGAAPADDPALVDVVVDHVYGEIDPEVRFAAVASTRAQLEYLAAIL
ncbi:MBL fold metallo-hydrolase [Microbacterium sp. E-13]|uniref:MBL fold metallo-hydrolase n=1 Tax=Microbacterium sp. E-13 TaxID=3404048 RepID=UPI003CEB681A